MAIDIPCWQQNDAFLLVLFFVFALVEGKNEEQ